MARVTFSVPDDVQAAFYEAFGRRNKSALLAELMRQAVQEHERQQRHARAIAKLLALRKRMKPVTQRQITRARRQQRP